MIKYLLCIILLAPVLSQSDSIPAELRKLVDEATRDINKAADFLAHDINGNEIRLSDYSGRVVLINFWATWCAPCRMEIPDLKELRARYGEKGFEILGVSISDNQNMLKKFADAYSIAYPLLYCSSNELGKIALNYGGLQGVPQSFLIDSNGEIVLHFPGAILKKYDPRSFNYLEEKIISALKDSNYNSKDKVKPADVVPN